MHSQRRHGAPARPRADDQTRWDTERTTWGDWLLRAIIVVPSVAVAAYAMGWLG